MGTASLAETTPAKCVDWLIAEVERLMQVNELEREIAYQAARSDIGCYCKGHRESLIWYDIESPEADEGKEMVDTAVQYLEIRGLLMRHPTNSDLARPLDVEAVRS